MFVGPPPPIGVVLGANPGPGYGGGGPRMMAVDVPGMTPAIVACGSAQRRGTVTEPAAV